MTQVKYHYTLTKETLKNVIIANKSKIVAEKVKTSNTKMKDKEMQGEMGI